jgi:hypothetical protein
LELWPSWYNPPGNTCCLLAKAVEHTQMEGQAVWHLVLEVPLLVEHVLLLRVQLLQLLRVVLLQLQALLLLRQVLGGAAPRSRRRQR